MNFKLYIGLTTKDGRHLYKDYVINQVAKLSDNFTVIEATGYYKGTRENSLIFEFYNQNIDDLVKLQGKIEQLSFDLYQECIGLYDCGLDKFYLLNSKNHIVIDSNDDDEEYFTEHWLFNK